jgi:hypothetical protein
MSEFDLTDEVEPDEQPDAEEYEASEREEVSPETGTVYDPTGQAETTPQDLEAGDDDEDESGTGSGGAGSAGA